MAAVAGRPQRAGGLERLARSLDLLLLPGVAVGGVLLGAAPAGVAIGAGSWLAQRIVGALDRGLINQAREPRNRLGLHLAEGYARIWLLASAIVAAGVGVGRAAGLAAAVCICVAYTIAFLVKIVFGPPERPRFRKLEGVHG